MQISEHLSYPVNPITTYEAPTKKQATSILNDVAAKVLPYTTEPKGTEIATLAFYRAEVHTATKKLSNEATPKKLLTTIKRIKKLAKDFATLKFPSCPIEHMFVFERISNHLKALNEIETLMLRNVFACPIASGTLLSLESECVNAQKEVAFCKTNSEKALYNIKLVQANTLKTRYVTNIQNLAHEHSAFYKKPYAEGELFSIFCKTLTINGILFENPSSLEAMLYKITLLGKQIFSTIDVQPHDTSIGFHYVSTDPNTLTTTWSNNFRLAHEANLRTTVNN